MDQDTHRMIFRLMADLDRYIEENWVPEQPSDTEISSPVPDPESDDRKGSSGHDGLPSFESLEVLISGVGKTFHELLFEMISTCQMTDVEVYRRANIDRKLFSKIRSNPAYHPGKNTVLALAIALKLDLQGTEELLASAEYAFSPGSKSDIVVRYFIEHGIYDINVINIALYDHGLQPLESK